MFNSELRSTTPDAIAAYVRDQFEFKVHVEFAPEGELITIPEGWHGAGKKGEALVLVGDMLTKPISGTKLSAKSFLEWSQEKGFSFIDDGNNQVDVQRAVTIIEGNRLSESNNNNRPLLRLTRVEGVPIEIQFYGGATNKWIQILTEIGNKDFRNLSDYERDDYRHAVLQLFRPFISKGTKEERARLGLPSDVNILRRADDCAASFVTFIGDQIIDDLMGFSRDNLLEVHDVSVATMQAIVLAIAVAERRGVPAIFRIGGPGFGLGKGKELNYVMKNDKLLLGDMGGIMDDGESADATPNLVQVRNNGPSRELRLFLGGGRPVSRMFRTIHDEREKPIGWDIAIRRASRVDNGPEHWGVLISGTKITGRTDRRPQRY